jgi:hypothetical protein
MRPATAYGSWCSLDAAAGCRRRRQCPVGAQASEFMRLFTKGGDYVKQIGFQTEEGSERVNAAFGRIILRPARCLEEQVRPNEPTPS